jgi:hypothetical protein
VTTLFAVIPEVLPVAGVGDLIGRLFANRSIFPSGSKLLGDVSLTQTTSVVNANRIGASPALVLGTSVDLTGTEVVNTSVFGASTLQEQPATGFLRATEVINTSTIGGAGAELLEAPADGFLRATVVTNTSAFGASVLTPEEEVGNMDDYDPMIGAGPLGSRPL